VPVIVATGASRYLAAMRPYVALLLVVSLSACLWHSYDEVLRVHLSVLTQMTDKLDSFAEADHVPTAAEMAEFLYPAQRGRIFLRRFTRYENRASYRAFTQFLDRYEAMLKRVDAARLSDADWRRERPDLAREHKELATMANAIRRQLSS
jgi:hypothetical protein